MSLGIQESGIADVPEADERFGIQSVETAAAILSAMAGAAGAQALKEIAAGAGMPSGKVHRYLVSLVRTGLAIQEADGRYAIGPQAITLGLAGLRALSPVKAAPEFLRALRDETGETSALMLWNERGPVVVDIEESPRPIFMNIRPGSLLPVARSAAGLVFASFLPGDARVHTDTGERHVRALLGEDGDGQTAAIRAKNYAVVHGMLVPGISAMAAPVFDHRGAIAATLAFLIREEELAGAAEEEKASVLVRTADAFSARLGGSRPVVA